MNRPVVSCTRRSEAKAPCSAQAWSVRYSGKNAWWPPEAIPSPSLARRGRATCPGTTTCRATRTTSPQTGQLSTDDRIAADVEVGVRTQSDVLGRLFVTWSADVGLRQVSTNLPLVTSKAANSVVLAVVYRARRRCPAA